jgi:hypothetical protein
MVTRLYQLPLTPDEHQHLRETIPQQRRAGLIRLAMVQAGLLPERVGGVRCDLKMPQSPTTAGE